MVKLKLDSYELYKEIITAINKYDEINPETVSLILREILKEVHKVCPIILRKETVK